MNIVLFILYISNNFETAKKTLDLFYPAGIVIVLWQNPRPGLVAGITEAHERPPKYGVFLFSIFWRVMRGDLNGLPVPLVTGLLTVCGPLFCLAAKRRDLLNHF